ncbi:MULTISPECIES: UDP-N-acetylmuramoyl-L-alanyl-D-glutamate--2,6-diaminopimelate ligase [Peribacillus]|uniref:UDP-N-acetylmuramoyl-L-alanyl-D-glutamate--2, 6-diaminopimelate ligase n=1 Tax=Peribacillus TaxID=2675229 RepID=UPI001F4ED15D|nr:MULTISPECIES: UDP-N-acetylmuramoyl-L-alanyl-D-glutamate--2,6-diaminopimelate ligase [unclassified Peribacillus]MCK1984014.1 UDP-N-acetylmuramoyl-L-alanyl-D-glutamate--2,6-diaminopimelate ligase [Peribacillus sp. Aquil_B1]MCK2010977.1 UDP-N-acetylmuramoyl-L-alanyl-D-glutamate--2,6-diaminopimelate ligase [Peribacillus sp. Aquil_B8]
MKLHKLLSYLHSLFPYEGENPEITSIENDNRKVIDGSLFVCIKGYTVDGHDFAQLAVEHGAAAIIAERPLDLDVPVIVVRDSSRAMAVLADAFYGHPTQKMRLIGITGTNGKTTTSHLLEKIFEDRQEKTGLIGTMYTKIADTVYETKNTTPDSVTLQKAFHEMAEASVTTAIMEVSSHALELGRVHGCDYDIAVFTNLTQDHLDFHKTMDRYRQAKSLFFSQLGNAYIENRPKYAVLNADDEATADFIKATAATVVTYGIDKEADIRATDIKIDANGTSFTLTVGKEERYIQLKLIGKFSVYNVLSAISAALCAGNDLDETIKSIEEIKGVAGRFELITANQDFPVIVDYAHTPDSLENVLKTVGEFARKKIFVIVGCGGDRDKTKRPIMAEIACSLATDPIFTSDNPRSEDAAQILRDMEAGVAGKEYTVIEDRRQAIAYAVSKAAEGDVILIAGKGHETYQLVGDEVLHFDDREEAEKAIQNRLGSV